MSDYKIRLENFSNAMDRLNEALALPDESSFKVDVCVKRFEFTYETCKKTLESALQYLEIFTKNPREVIRESEKQGFISGLEIWNDMRDDRNDSSHEYNERKVAQIAKNAPRYLKEFEYVLNQLRLLDSTK